MGLQDHLSKITGGLQEHLEKPGARAAGKGRGVPATSSLAHFSDEMKNASEELAELKRNVGQPLQVQLSLCDDGPYHTTPLDLTRVAELTEQLRVNPQSTPLLLRRKPDGRFEIVAGRHRKAALIALGKPVADAVIKELDDDTAERLTFYDNLFAPSLSDYAKYLGFSARKRSKGLTGEQLAQEAGISPALVSFLLSFEQLPEKALQAIQANQKAVGATLARELATRSESMPDRVSECVELVISGKLTQSKAVAWLDATPRAAAPARPETKVVRRGKAKFAEYVRRSGQVVVRFASEDDVDRFETELSDLLKRLAAPATPT